MRRTDGKNGWIKIPCPYSSTAWAWGKGTDQCSAECTCEPCQPPKNPKP